jgi:hypothetical protein
LPWGQRGGGEQNVWPARGARDRAASRSRDASHTGQKPKYIIFHSRLASGQGCSTTCGIIPQIEICSTIRIAHNFARAHTNLQCTHLIPCSAPLSATAALTVHVQLYHMQSQYPHSKQRPDIVHAYLCLGPSVQRRSAPPGQVLSPSEALTVFCVCSSRHIV